MGIRVRFDKDLQTLRDKVIRLGSRVDTSIGRSTQALKERNRWLARRIIAEDEQINDLRFEIEKDSVVLIARQQPTGHDLRLIVAVMNIVLDLERIGDHTTGIATIVLRMGDEPLLKPLIDLPRMTYIAQEMLRASLDAFVEENRAKGNGHHRAGR